MPQTKDRRREWDAARLAAGISRTAEDLRTCWRCGVQFDGQCSYHLNAPCKDCRQFLRQVDGERTAWKGSGSTLAKRVQL